MKAIFMHCSWLICLICCYSCSKKPEIQPNLPTETFLASKDYENLLIDSEKIHLSEIDASQISKLFMCMDNPLPETRSAFMDRKVEEVFPIKGTSGVPSAYVVNFEGGGYSIVSATKKYVPILAFNNDGYISAEALECNGLAFWASCITTDIARKEQSLEEHSSEYIEIRSLWKEYEKKQVVAPVSAYTTSGYDWYLRLRNIMMSECGDANTNRTDFYYKAQTYGTFYDLEAEERRRRELDRVLAIQYAGHSVPPCFVWGEGATNGGQATETEIPPLLKTYWNQNEPYNALMPPSDLIAGRNKFAGCVTIAVAQLMNYYCHPAIVDGTPIDWTQTQVSEAHGPHPEIEKLIKVVHVGVESEFIGDEAGSNFTKATRFLSRNGYGVLGYSTSLEQIIANEVQAGRPVLVGGYDINNNGHAWVCDGYYSKDYGHKIMAYEITNTANQNFPNNPYRSILEESKINNFGKFFHMNWGWGKQYDFYPTGASTIINGWFLSVFDVDYNRNLEILQVVK